MMPRKVSLRTVLIGAFLVVAMLPIVLLSVQRYRSMAQQFVKEDLAQDLTIARAVAAGLNSYMWQRRVFLQEPAKLDDHFRRSGESVNPVREAKLLDCLPETFRDQCADEGCLQAHGAATRSRDAPASALDFLIFS